MKTTGIGIALALLLTIPLAAQEVISVKDVAGMVNASDPDIRIAELRAQAARAEYQNTVLQVRPNVSIDITPYSYSRLRVPGSAGSSVDTRTQSVAAGISLSQGLPTSGRLTGSLTNTISQISGTSDEYKQVPSLSATLSQPLFVGSAPIDTSVFRATRRAAEIGQELSGEEARFQQNQSIRGGMALFVQVATLRRSKALLETTVDVLGRQIDDAEIQRERGSVSDTNILALRVNLNARRDLLLQTELSLVQAEQELRRVLGVNGAEALVLDDALPPVVNADEPSLEAVDQNNFVLKSGRYTLELAQLQDRFNDGTDRPTVSISVSASPEYPDARTSPDDFGTSIADYFEEGATIESSVAVGLSIPLLTKAERQARETIDRSAVEQALVGLENAQTVVANQAKVLLLNRSILLTRLESVAIDIEYEEDRLDNEQSLLDAQASTRLRVDEVALDLSSRQNERWQVEAELFLNGLDLLITAGIDLTTVF